MGIALLALTLLLTPSALAATEPRLFMSYSQVDCEDEQLFLDEFAQALRDTPSARAYVIYYGGRNHATYRKSAAQLPWRGEAEVRARRISGRLIDFLGFNLEEVAMVNGGFREHWTAELWIVPPGAAEPPATPSVPESEIRYRNGKVPRHYYGRQCAIG